MEFKDHLPNTESEEAMTEAIKNMQPSLCDKKNHMEVKDQLCIDEECNKTTEQFTMQCADCVDAGMHKKKKHKTKKTKRVLKTILTSTFAEEKKQKKSGAKTVISDHL